MYRDKRTPRRIIDELNENIINRNESDTTANINPVQSSYWRQWGVIRTEDYGTEPVAGSNNPIWSAHFNRIYFPVIDFSVTVDAGTTEIFISFSYYNEIEGNFVINDALIVPLTGGLHTAKVLWKVPSLVDAEPLPVDNVGKIIGLGAGEGGTVDIYEPDYEARFINEDAARIEASGVITYQTQAPNVQVYDFGL